MNWHKQTNQKCMKKQTSIKIVVAQYNFCEMNELSQCQIFDCTSYLKRAWKNLQAVWKTLLKLKEACCIQILYVAVKNSVKVPCSCQIFMHIKFYKHHVKTCKQC